MSQIISLLYQNTYSESSQKLKYQEIVCQIRVEALGVICPKIFNEISK